MNPHSQANFAVDLDHSDKFLKKKSVVTALFNSYGTWGLPVNNILGRTLPSQYLQAFS